MKNDVYSEGPSLGRLQASQREAFPEMLIFTLSFQPAFERTQYTFRVLSTALSTLATLVRDIGPWKVERVG